MNNNLDKIRSLCKNYEFTGNTSDEFLFTINCVDYFYFNKNIGQVDILDGFSDGSGDGGIDFVYNDSEKLYFIQGKSTSNLSYDEIRDAFYKMVETLNSLQEKKFDAYNKRLVNIYKDKIDIVDSPSLQLVLFTNTRLDDSTKKRVDAMSKEEAFDNFEITVYGKNELELQEQTVDGENQLVKEGFLFLDSTKNSLTYQNGIGAVFSVRASSLKELYLKYSTSGLFGYNLREHIAQKSVDSNILKTIQNEKENFWFFNNGITIGCSDYRVDGNKLVLYDFSIINGAQTTTNIGKSNLVDVENDFYIVCKVVKSPNSLEDDFIRRISEASNSQKPIKFRDLKSNSYEQHLLQNNSINAKHKLAIEIKRGVKPRNYKYVENSWQRVTNEYLGQLLLSFQFQLPGTARSKTSDIFGNDSVYNLIFSRDRINKYDYETIYAFVKLAHLYDDFKCSYEMENYKKVSMTDNDDMKKELNDKTGMCRNAKFTCMALLGYLYKRIIKKIDEGSTQKLENEIIVGDFSLNHDSDESYMENLNYLFEFMIDNLNDLYAKKQSTLKLTGQSNFLKSDKYYREIIIPAFEKLINDRYLSIGIIQSMEIFK